MSLILLYIQHNIYLCTYTRVYVFSYKNEPILRITKYYEDKVWGLHVRDVTLYRGERFQVPSVPYIILRTCNLDYRCQIENLETYRIDDHSGITEVIKLGRARLLRHVRYTYEIKSLTFEHF